MNQQGSDHRSPLPLAIAPKIILLPAPHRSLLRCRIVSTIMIEQQQQQQHAEAAVATSVATFAAPPSAISDCFSQDAIPSHAAPKRQRRPNVRLGEIGDRPLATVLEFFLKRKKRRGTHSKRTVARPRSVIALKHESASGLADGKSEVRGEAGQIRAPRTPLTHLRKTRHASKASASSSLKPRAGTERNLASGGEGVVTRRFLSKNRRLGMRRHARNNTSRSLKRSSNVRRLVYKEGSWRGPAGPAHTGAPAEVLGGSKGNKLDGGSKGYSLDGGHGVGEVRDRKLRSFQHQEEPNPNNSGSSFQKNFLDANGAGMDSQRRVTGLKINENLNVVSLPDVDASPKIGRDTKRETPKVGMPEAFPVHLPLWETDVTPLAGEVKNWLNDLGLAKYACVFQHHEVDNDALPLLTMDDLREMEITAVGARRKMFCEIQKLRQGQALESENLSKMMTSPEVA